MALQSDIYTIKGTVTETLDLPEEIFAVTASPHLLAQAVRVYQLNQRHAHAKAKGRGEVVTSTRKIYRQKGTGRARHGDLGAPIFVGGGKAHGPTGLENYKRRLTKAMRRKARLAALTYHFNQKTLAVVSDLEKVQSKTKKLQEALEAITQYPKTKKVLIILAEPKTEVIKAAGNLEGVTVTQAHRLNTYEILNHDYLLFTKEALERLAETLKIDYRAETKKVKAAQKKTAQKTSKPTTKKSSKKK